MKETWRKGVNPRRGPYTRNQSLGLFLLVLAEDSNEEASYDGPLGTELALDYPV